MARWVECNKQFPQCWISMYLLVHHYTKLGSVRPFDVWAINGNMCIFSRNHIYKKNSLKITFKHHVPIAWKGSTPFLPLCPQWTWFIQNVGYCYMVVILWGVYDNESTMSDVLLLFMFCGSSSRCHGLVCSVWLCYFLIILTLFNEK